MKKAACLVVILLTSAIFCFASSTPFCVSIDIPTVDLGELNERAKILPMPQIDRRDASLLKKDVQVRVLIDLQSGKVKLAYAYTEVPDSIRKSVVKAARDVRFEPVAEGFSALQGAGIIVYKPADLNGETVLRDHPPGLFTRDETLQDKAASLPIPRPVQINDSVFNGQVRVAVVVNAKDGKVEAVKAVYGIPVLHAVGEQAAYQARFKPSGEKGGAPEFWLGTLVYNIGGEGTGSAGEIETANALPGNEIAYAGPVELPGVTYKPCSS